MSKSSAGSDRKSVSIDVNQLIKIMNGQNDPISFDLKL